MPVSIRSPSASEGHGSLRPSPQVVDLFACAAFSKRPSLHEMWHTAFLSYWASRRYLIVMRVLWCMKTSCSERGLHLSLRSLVPHYLPCSSSIDSASEACMLLFLTPASEVFDGSLEDSMRLG